MNNVLIDWQKEFLVQTDFDVQANETNVVKLSELDDFLRKNPNPPKPEWANDWDDLNYFNEIYKMNKSWFQKFYEKIRLGFGVIDNSINNSIFCGTKRELTDSIGVPINSKYMINYSEYLYIYCETYGYPKRDNNQDVSIDVTAMLINGTKNDAGQVNIAFESQTIEFVIKFNENEE